MFIWQIHLESKKRKKRIKTFVNYLKGKLN
jgi:hypothetical protein